jgi:phenylalanyl-tRNA synthetase beta chain
MRVPLSWLREMVPAAPHDPEAVGSALTLLGVELDVIESPPATPSGVYAARVLEKREIEGARACFVVVDAGPFGVREVVCGAHNFGPGDLLPLALPGARLPNGMEIARREVRLPLGPVVSDGMLCAPDELALSDDHSGIHHLDRGEPGTDVRALLGLDEWVLVFEITPNRPDAMSMAGLARELAAVFGGPLNLPAVQPLLAPDSFPVDIADAGLCPRYVAIAVDGVTIGPSPIDVQHRLRAAGVRPINNVVDATNYVLMERGQPLHAFDLSLLAGPRIAVRPAVDGERITTLDGTERMLEQGDILICDAARPVALGGIMGGADTEVTGATSRILIESAMFLSTSILQTSKRLGLRSEASARFERGGDPEQTLEAAMRCADLIEAWSGGRRVAVTDRCRYRQCAAASPCGPIGSTICWGRRSLPTISGRCCAGSTYRRPPPRPATTWRCRAADRTWSGKPMWPRRWLACSATTGSDARCRVGLCGSGRGPPPRSAAGAFSMCWWDSGSRRCRRGRSPAPPNSTPAASAAYLASRSSTRSTPNSR